ncbi:MAG TPA: ATP-binding protein [Bryobacteraceae bacterium]|nr:ATP-binding protein [Bryobacteraceae bacterium]
MWFGLAGFFLAASVVCALGWLSTHRKLRDHKREHKNQEQVSRFIEEERRVLELMARGASLKDVLHALTIAIERMAPGCFCSILLLDEDGRHLHEGAGGSLPREYMRRVEGLEIGPEVGSCGSAAFLNETVIVTDIATDSRWAAAKELPLGFGLRACWSVPVRGSGRRVLGTFAMYHQSPSSPDAGALAIVEAGAHLAGNAIERLTAEQKVRDSLERLRLAEQAAGFGVWELDLSNGMMWLSEGASLLSGTGPGAITIAQPELEKRIHPEDRNLTQMAVERAIREGRSYEVEFRVAQPDGSIGWRRVQGSAKESGDGRRRIVGAIIDTTKEKTMLEQLRESERQLAHKQKLESIGHLAAGIAHEINTPIQYIGDNGKFLEDAFRSLTQEPGDAKTLEFYKSEVPKAIAELLDGVGRVAGIVRAMKEFSHPGSLNKVAVDLNHAIESTILVSKHEWKYVAEITTDFDRDLPPVPCLAGEVNQVILNLIVNSAQAISEGLRDSSERGAIHIRTRREGDFAEIRVSDTGCGIPEAIRSKVFNPFFTTKPVGKGTGYGLALAHSIVVQRHSGSIHFESEPGRGTTFIVRLPLGGAEWEAPATGPTAAVLV